MGNQQETINQAEIGWLAGIIDGEGSIAMNVRKKELRGWQGYGIDVCLTVTNSDAAIIDKCEALLGKMGLTPLVYQVKNAPLYRADGRRYQNVITRILRLSLSRMADILRCLIILQPHLTGQKRARANLLCRFLERRLKRQTKRSKGGRAHYDHMDWDLVRQFYELKKTDLPDAIVGILRDYTREAVVS